MRNIAVINLDTKRDENGFPISGIMIANNERRTEIARAYSQSFEASEITSRFYEKMFDPTLVNLDKIEDHAKTFLTMIEIAGFEVILLTSRPHTMKAKTEQWLARNGIVYTCHYKNYGTGQAGDDGKIDHGDRFTKTATWKARFVKGMLDGEILQGGKVDCLFFVDDEKANREAVEEWGDPRVHTYADLENAANMAAYIKKYGEL